MCAKSKATAIPVPEVEPVITIDSGGGVFVNGENSLMSVADYVSNHSEHAPLIDGAWRDLVVNQRESVAAALAKIEDRIAGEVEKARGQWDEKFSLITKAAEFSIEARNIEIERLEKELAAAEIRIGELESRQEGLSSESLPG